jgi:hypothetical protein
VSARIDKAPRRVGLKTGFAPAGNLVGTRNKRPTANEFAVTKTPTRFSLAQD